MSVWRTTPLVVGHRGGRGEGWPPENTIAAFAQARRQGALAVELDVRPCAGGQIVVFHDATLSRSSGGRDQRRVGDVHLAELRAMGVPTLEEALWWARSNGVGVNVEMKHDLVNRMALARETVHAIRVTGADVLLSSFDPLLLALASVLAPRVARALIVHAGQPLWADVLQRVVGPPYVQALHIERTQATPGTQRTTNLDMGWYLRRTLRVGVWTVNDPREALELVRLGAASIITDAPGAILQALTRS